MANPRDNNQLSRYGAIARTYAALNPQAKVFFLAPASASWFGDFQFMFPVDGDGVPRVHTSFAAVNAAVVADRGDVVLVLPGYTESVAGAAGINLSVSGVSYIGLGNGSLRPTLTFTTATTATVTITAANITIENIFATSTFDAVVSPFVVSAAGVTFKNCVFETASASAQVTQMILTTAAANNFTIDSCRFYGTADAGNTCAVTIVGGNNLQIVNSNFTGAYTTTVGAIRSITTLNTNCVIRDNTIVNLTASATKGITLLTGSTGQIMRNTFGIGSGAAPITADAAWWGGSWTAAAVGTNSTLI